MPGLDPIRENKRCQYEVEHCIGELSDDELCLTARAICQCAGDDAEEEKRNSTHRGGKAQLKRRVGDLVNQVAPGDVVHPLAQAGVELPKPKEPKIADGE